MFKIYRRHSDVVAGVAIGSHADINSMFSKEHAYLGAKMAPFEAWLILRSLRTLRIRMLQHQQSALSVANFLEQHPKINHVSYPGLKSFPQRELAERQMQGYSGLMSFELNSNDLAKIKKFVNTLEYFKIGVSWGGHESLMYAPAISYLKEMSPKQFEEMGISIGLMRMSVGLEDPEDLIADLDRALSHL